MKKQKAIQKAYGELWEKAQNLVDENGFIPDAICIIKDIHFDNVEKRRLSDHFQWKRRISVLCCRPLILKGLETNNDWISVTEKDLLPKPGTNVFIVKDGEISKRVWTVDHLDRLVFEKETILKTQITHYKILEFPTEKPVY